jgi:hypothetical protein
MRIDALRQVALVSAAPQLEAMESTTLSSHGHSMLRGLMRDTTSRSEKSATVGMNKAFLSPLLTHKQIPRFQTDGHKFHLNCSLFNNVLKSCVSFLMFPLNISEKLSDESCAQ